MMKRTLITSASHEVETIPTMPTILFFIFFQFLT